MSAYVCDPRTFNRIVMGLRHCTTRGGHPSNYPTTKYGAQSLQITDLPQSKDLGQKLYEMNVAAVNQRYGEDDQPLDNYGYSMTGLPSPVQLLKSIECLLYQCSEGDVPETYQLFKDLTEFSHTLAHWIVSNTQAYEAADWG